MRFTPNHGPVRATTTARARHAASALFALTLAASTAGCSAATLTDDTPESSDVAAGADPAADTAADARTVAEAKAPAGRKTTPVHSSHPAIHYLPLDFPQQSEPYGERQGNDNLRSGNAPAA